MTTVHLNADSPVFPKFNEHDKVRLNSGGPVMDVVYYCDGDVFCTWSTESDAEVGSFFPEECLIHAVTELPQVQQVLTDADAAADLAGTPRPAPWTQQRQLDLGEVDEPRTSFSGYLSTLPPYRALDLDDDTPLAPACDLSGEGTCEACQ